MNRFKAIRGDLLTPLADGPLAGGALADGSFADGAVSWQKDGLLVWDRSSRIVHAGKATRRWSKAELVGGSEQALIMAPFWDPHLHLPQLDLAGKYHEPLLEWLERRVFPEEARYEDPAFSTRKTERFFRALRRAGTVGAGVFCAPFPHSARSALDHGSRAGMPLRCGAPLMDITPAPFERSASAWIRAVRGQLDRFGVSAALVPRYALSCSDRLMAEAGALARERRAWVLGHIAETHEEVAAVSERFHGAAYAEVYDRFGLLGPRTLLAHGIHLSSGELELLRKRRSVLVHCPSSNEALSSGRMPLEKVRESGVRWCLASDVGAGPELNMLHVMESFLRVHKTRARTTACEAYTKASLAGAEVLGFGKRWGALLPGYQADCLLVDRAPSRVRSAEGVIRALIERSKEQGWKEPIGRILGGSDM